MGLFKKTPDRDALIKQGLADAEALAAQQQQKGPDISTGNEKIDIEFTKVKAQLESINEIRKADAERFGHFSEQLGELRGMIVDTNKAMSKIEVAATKAVDLVESVHPEKLMLEVRKQDTKIESLRAMIESNDSIMKTIMAEMKKMRDQMSFYKGTEQVMKLNEEVKQELAQIKKTEAIVERHSDKVETVFLEVEKRFSSFQQYADMVKDLQESLRRITTDFEKVKAGISTKEDKREFVALLDKFNDFEKHTSHVLKLLDERNVLLKKELASDFHKLRTEIIVDVKKAKGQDALKEPSPEYAAVAAAEPVVEAAVSAVDAVRPGETGDAAEKSVVGEKKEAAAGGAGGGFPSRFLGRFKKK